MKGFKVGDKVVINLLTGGYSGKLKVGSVAIIGEFTIDRRSARMVGELNIIRGWHNLAKIKHAEKWSIYNNTLPWSELSDKQKGRMLLGDHKGIKFTIDNVAFTRVGFIGDNSVYKAQYIEPVKPEPTMEELFHSDFYDLKAGSVAIQMIAKGWTKPC